MKTRTTLSLILAVNGIIALILFIVAFVLLRQKKIEQSKVVFGGFGIMGFLEVVGLVFYIVAGRGRGRGRTALQMVLLMPELQNLPVCATGRVGKFFILTADSAPLPYALYITPI
jgi:hypothetical protein